jgi:cytochrome d ubiquinol oxidase subunit I
MDALALSRLQFAITTVYHFFFVPLTLGLSILVALMQTAYMRTGDETYKQMTKFWGKLFVINFAMGVVTGIVQEFQFGMNWSEYSRFMGDIFGAPLAVEALLAFFLESIFLGVWIFGWDRLPKRVHFGAIWAVAIGSNLSALWILVANSFMQEPVGYTLESGRALMSDFGALLTNPNVWVMYPHVLTAGMTTAAFFVLGISAWHLLRKQGDYREIFHRSFRWAAIYGLIGTFAVILIGHSQAQHMVRVQPMKMAAAEALYNTEDPASMSLITIGNLQQDEVFSIRVPALLSLLSYNQLTGAVQGINQLQAQYATEYGPGNYVPPIFLSYWSFRGMVGAGILMFFVAAYALWRVYKQNFETANRFLRWLPLAILLPYLANTTGWLMTELGRDPWIVHGLLRIQDAVSPNLTSAMVLFSLIAFTAIYALLMAADIYLLRYFARQPEHVFNPPDEAEDAANPEMAF